MLNRFNLSEVTLSPGIYKFWVDEEVCEQEWDEWDMTLMNTSNLRSTKISSTTNL